MARTRRCRSLLAVSTVLALPVLNLASASATSTVDRHAPRVTSISPARGPVSGGTRITLHGSHLDDVRSVTVGRRPATHVRVVSASDVTATVPAGAAGSDAVRARSAAGRSKPTSGSRYSYVARPSVTRVQLVHGSGLRGSQVTIHGRHLAGSVAVRFGRAAPVRGVVKGSATTVTVPANAPGRLHVTVATAGGTSRASADDVYQMPAPNEQRWNEQTYLASERDDLADVSCPTADDCFAIDDYDAVWRITDGTWGDPTHLPRAKYPALPRQISCPTTAFCAVAGGTHAYLYQDGAWSLGPALTSVSVSCPSAGQCLFVSSDSYTVLDDGTWSTAPTPIELDHVACWDDSDCIAAGQDGHGAAYLWDGSTWTAMSSLHDPHAGLIGLSCASATLCAADDDEGLVTVWDGTSWSTPVRLDPDIDISHSAVSCRDTGCVYDDAASVYTLHAGQWTPSASSADYDLVGCYSSTSCLGQDQLGHIASFDGTAWHRTSERLARVGPVSSLSCPTASYCAASDQSGNIFTYDGTGWSAPQKFGDTAYQQSAVSCPTTAFCLAVFGDGTAATFDGDQWSTAASPGQVETQVSCTSSSFCLGGGTHDSEIFDGHRWTVVPGAAKKIISLSCATSSFCVAVTPGELDTFDGTRWHESASDALLAYSDAHSVSCPSANFCLAVDGQGRQLEYHDGSWGDPVATLIAYPIALSCSSATFCQTFGNGSSQTYDGSVWTAVYQSGSFQDSMDVDGLSCYAAQSCIAASGDQVFASGPA